MHRCGRWMAGTANGKFREKAMNAADSPSSTTRWQAGFSETRATHKRSESPTGWGGSRISSGHAGASLPARFPQNDPFFDCTGTRT
jgi:hypothetical protein